jgi:flagellar motor switch protein FliN/FliY
MPADNSPPTDEDHAAAQWAAAGDGDAGGSSSQQADVSVKPAPFTNFGASGASSGTSSGASGGPGGDLNLILDIPVQLTVELGRTRVPIKHILQVTQGSVVELEAVGADSTSEPGVIVETFF